MIKALYRPIDAAILIYFRLVAGLLMAQELVNGLILGKLEQYISPRFNFHYMYLDWIKPWPGYGMVLHYAVTIFAGAAVAFNFHYKIFSKVLFLGYLFLFLFDQTEYINHIYLYCLISFWMMFLPLNERKTSQPAWILYLLLFHISVAYFFGGLAKLNPDWLSGSPMDIFLASRLDYPLGFLYERPWAPLAFSYGGLFFDLLIVPALIWKRTRAFAFVIAVFFHLSNVLMFGLATFPWFSILMTSMFLNPSWPRSIPILRKFLPWGLERVPEYKPNYALVSVLFIYGMLHFAIPLRQHFYPGTTAWTEEGHMFSWRMMLRDKRGSLNYFVQKPDGHIEVVEPLHHITKRQYGDLIGNPDLILTFAHYLRDFYGPGVSIFASSRVSLNGRPYRELIYPGVDLAKEKRSLKPYEWVRPLEDLSRDTASFQK